MDLREKVVRIGVDGTGSGSCPVVCCVVNGVEDYKNFIAA
jgi:hypothetical protein